MTQTVSRSWRDGQKMAGHVHGSEPFLRETETPLPGEEVETVYGCEPSCLELLCRLCAFHALSSLLLLTLTPGVFVSAGNRFGWHPSPPA